MIARPDSTGLSRFTERLPLLPSKPWVGYGATLALCLIALWVRWAVDTVFPPGYPYVTFFPVVILSSFLFGLRPGIVAALVCALFAWYYFIPPAGFAIDSHSIVAMMFYIAVVSIDIALVHWMQSANARLRTAREDVRKLADERGLLVDRAQVLFQELQHRVGNNLQMVGAVLSLQMRGLAEPSAKKALSDAARRLQVIGHIQRQLYQQDGALVPLDIFIDDVVTKIMASSAHPGITCTVEAERDIVMRPGSAVPMALIVSEAIANALEHGLAGRTDGHVSVELYRRADQVVLTVTDNGVGLPEGFDHTNTDSVGLRISRVLALQLGAEHSLVSSAGGTSMKLKVPESRLAEPQ